MSTAPESKKSNGEKDEVDPEMKPEEEDEAEEHRSPGVLHAFRTLAERRWGSAASDDYELHTRPVSGAGDNSYGHVFQVRLTRRSDPSAEPLVAILKVAPKKPARRQHMRVVDFYCREVFMYERVFAEYRQLAADLVPAISPHMMYSSLAECDEFIVFEDLTLSGYVQNFRSNMPTYDLVACALRSLAQLHAMSFVLQARDREKFTALVSGMNDNLFSEEIAEVSLEFGKKYLRRTGDMLQEEDSEGSESRQQQIAYVRQLERNFRAECFRCVNGPQNAPYAVICHGDFWNNNILYKHEAKNSSGGGQAVAAKLIDFQMSRYAPPVLDVINYLFVCIEKDLREAHFAEFLDIYHGRLCQVVDSFEGLRGDQLYPRPVFDEQLRQFGVYGLCMASFAIPFFISTNNEIPDLDEVSTACTDLEATATAASSSGGEEKSQAKVETSVGSAAEDPDELIDKCRKLVDEYDMLTERSIPIFRRRMFGIVEDLHKYQMLCMSS